MCIEIITVEDMLDEWRDNPHKLLAWILRELFLAQIKPNEPFTWSHKPGLILIGKGIATGHMVNLRLCSDCYEQLNLTPFEPQSVTVVDEKECQCVCHTKKEES